MLIDTCYFTGAAPRWRPAGRALDRPGSRVHAVPRSTTRQASTAVAERGIALPKPPAEEPRPAQLHRGKPVYYCAAVCPTRVMALVLPRGQGSGWVERESLAVKGVGGWRERERSGSPCLNDHLQDGSPERQIFTPDLVSLIAVTTNVNSLVLLINRSTLLGIRLVRYFGVRA